MVAPSLLLRGAFIHGLVVFREFFSMNGRKSSMNRFHAINEWRKEILIGAGWVGLVNVAFVG